jgi:hypothetical protein
MMERSKNVNGERVPLTDKENIEINSLEAMPKPDPLTAWRETHNIPVAEFCMSLYRMGRLPATEAVEAAQRIWPPTFNAGIAHLSEEDQVAAKLQWADAKNVRRNHAWIGILQKLSVVVNGAKLPPMTEAEVDTLFGWVAP